MQALAAKREGGARRWLGLGWRSLVQLGIVRSASLVTTKVSCLPFSRSLTPEFKSKDRPRTQELKKILDFRCMPLGPRAAAYTDLLAWSNTEIGWAVENLFPDFGASVLKNQALVARMSVKQKSEPFQTPGRRERPF